MTQQDKKKATYEEIVKALEGIEKEQKIDADAAKEWLGYLREVLKKVKPEEKIEFPVPPKFWIFHWCKSKGLEQS